MEINEKIFKLEEKGFDWLEIAELLDITYEEVRRSSEEVCKKFKAVDRHHNDYSKPFKVKFLCHKCHKGLSNE